jgi:hypothetical protein
MLLASRRGIRNRKDAPRLSVAAILRWADTHCRRFGDWPTAESGAIIGAKGETWTAIDLALKAGARGLRGRSSLFKLLAAKYGMRRPPLSVKQILPQRARVPGEQAAGRLRNTAGLLERATKPGPCRGGVRQPARAVGIRGRIPTNQGQRIYRPTCPGSARLKQDRSFVRRYLPAIHYTPSRPGRRRNKQFCR